MSGRLIAIGDIHGCSLALEALLKAIDPTPEDTIVTLGDYIDRGPDSRGVIDQLLALEKRCQLIPLLGNHEVMLIGALEVQSTVPFWLRCGGTETLTSYGGWLDSIPEDHLDFVRRTRRFYETDEYLFFHANYDADLSPDEQPDDVLFWNHLTIATPARHKSGKTAFVGHTPQISGKVLDFGHLICLDTFCFGDGCLTAMDVNSREIWQANKAGNGRLE